MTFLELQKEVAARLSLNFSSLRYHTLQQIKDAINEGYECISEATEWYEVSQTITLTTSIYYDLWALCTKPFLAIRRIFNTTTNWWLRPTTIQELDDNYRTWELNSGGQPQRMLLRAASWLGTYPKMSAASGTLTMKHSAMPDALAADGDSPGFPSVHHSALADYATYELLCQEKEFDRALMEWEEYSTKETALGEWVGARIRMDRSNGLKEEGEYLG